MGEVCAFLASQKLKFHSKNTDITALEASMAGFHMQEQSEERKPGITFGIVNGKLAVNGINY